MKTLSILFTALLCTPAGALSTWAPQSAGESAASSGEEPNLEVLVQEFADWRLEASTEVPGREALLRLEKLRLDAEKLVGNHSEDPAVLAFTTEVQARVLLEMQRTGDQEALAHELMRLRLVAFESTEVTPLGEVARGLLRRPEIVALAAAVPVAEKLTALPQATQAGEDEVIAEAVRGACARRDVDFLKSLGSRALPELERLALKIDGSFSPDAEPYPLQIMMQIDPVQALDTAARLVEERGTLLVKQVVVNVLTSHGPLHRPPVWTPEGESGWRFTHPEWHRFFNSLVSDPAVDEIQLEGLVKPLIHYGVIPEGLMPIALRLGPVRSGRAVSKGQAEFAVRCLASESEKVRRDAIEVLEVAGNIREALPLASDPSELVRMRLAQALKPVLVSRWTGPLRESLESSLVVLPTEEAEVQRALFVLLNDPSREVFAKCLHSMTDLVEHAGKPVLSLDLRLKLLDEAKADRFYSVYHAVLESAPRDEVERLTVRGIRVAENSEMSTEARDVFSSAVLGVMNDDPDLRWALIPEFVSLDFSEQFVAENLAHWATMKSDNFSVVDRYLDQLETLDSGLAWKEAGYRTHVGYHEGPGWGRTLADAQIQRLWKGISRHRAETNWDEITALPVDAQLSAQLIGSPEIAPELKLRSLVSVRDGWGMHLTMPVLQALAEAARDTDDVGSFLEAIDLLPKAKVQDFLLLALETPDAQISGGFAEPSIPDEWLLGLKIDKMREEVLDAVLNRFPSERIGLEEFRDSLDPQLLKSAVEAMVQSGLPKYETAIQAAAENPKLQGALVSSIARHRPEGLFGLLTDLVRSAGAGGGLWHSGVSAVASYMNDEAMGFLLEHAREVSTTSSRKIVMNYLEEIRQWQESVEQWERSRSAQNQRLDSIAELVALAEDSSLDLSVRAEALRGLGLLGATGELPRLVRALSAPEEQLREAAREAIDRLHASADSEE